MEGGLVRAILLRHAEAMLVGAPPPPANQAVTSRSPDASANAAAPRQSAAGAGIARDPVPLSLPDPNELRPAVELARVLASLDPPAQRELAASYVALWARTFRTLVVHLRGRPERALALFADEVYPFLRGDALAARVEHASGRHATLLLASGLPAPYVAGLVRSFVALSGARCDVAAAGPARFAVTYQVAAGDRFARLAQAIAALRLNLMLPALLAGALGVGLATAAHAAGVTASRVAVVLGGIAAAQLAANALHALRHPSPAGRFAMLRPARPALVAQLVSAAVLAFAAAIWLATTGTPLVLLFAAAGILAGLAYAPLRDRGAGPAVIGLLYGPLIAEGALHAFAVGSHHASHLAVLPWTIVPGALAAASLYLDDLADAPLDEAGGKRTLAVRLPRRSHGLVYTALLSLGFLPFVLLMPRLAAPGPAIPLTLLALAIAALLLAFWVRRSLGDPRRLAAARLGTQAVHVGATGVVLALVAAGAA